MEISRGLLDHLVENLTVLSEEGIALRALSESSGSEVELLANGAGELSSGIGQEVDASVGSHGVGPSIHDVVVVDSDDVDLINARLLELVNVLDEGRDLETTHKYTRATVEMLVNMVVLQHNKGWNSIED